ncbi:MAG: alpha/beta fold hydrolase [Spirochaetes bacterium]|jgi:pimeloyl-ACP methyl ester carboxylesterase|nr:alpha/beta fold hydrolase [Spirochaetota bacterium]
MQTRRVLKWIALGIPTAFVIGIALLIGSSYVEHRTLIEEEQREYPAPGVLVEVNDEGDRLHVYAEGEGNETLVFMSGFGTSSPFYDFKVLFEELSDDYRVAVVERAGYGWSDITSSPRDIDTVLRETRAALQIAGERPPYVLFPHSMAGLEALHWASLYPEEVQAVISLDSVVPGYVEQSGEEPDVSAAITFLTRTGLVRNQPGVFESNFHAMQKGHLTEEEADAARTIFFRRLFTKNMWEEADTFISNSRLVAEHGTVDVPFHAFISNENEDPQWAESIASYAEATGGGSSVLDGHHYIHLDFPELIAERSTEIIENSP